MPTVAEVIDYAKISQYLATVDIAKGNMSQNKDLPYILYMEGSILEDVYTASPNDEGLTKAANYVYALCGKYGVLAQKITSANSGQVTYNPSTGQLLNGLLFPQYHFIVGQKGALMNEGDTTLTINDQRMIAGTVDIISDGYTLAEGATDRFSFAYTQSATVLNITFNQPVVNGQEITIKYIKGGQIQGSVTKSTQPTLYYTPAYGETSVIFTELIGIGIDDIISVMIDLPRIPTESPTSNMKQIQYTSATGRFDLPSGDMFTGDQTIIVQYMV